MDNYANQHTYAHAYHITLYVLKYERILDSTAKIKIQIRIN